MRYTVSENAVGTMRDYQKEPVDLIRTFPISLRRGRLRPSSSGTTTSWSGNCGDDKEKAGASSCSS